MGLGSIASLERSINRKLQEKSQSPVSKDGYPPGVQLSLDVIREEEVDPELRHKILRRIELLDRAATDKQFRRDEIDRCKQSVVYFANNWCWTYDPRVKPATIPFDLFPKQEEYLIWRKERRSNKENGIIEKSRDMGLTWLNCLAQLHSFLFETAYKGSIASRKEMLVDRLGDPDSIFEKIRILVRNLPEWLKPKSYQDSFLKLINHDNSASITGESGPSIGRGGRATVYDVDESAFLEQAKRVDSALSENCPVIFWTSTINIFDPNNLFDEKIDRGTIPVFQFHWRDDPRKDDEWYKKRCETLDPLVVAAEIDIDRDAAVENATIPAAWIKAAIERWKPQPYAPVNILGCDVGRVGDPTVIALRYGYWIDELKVYQGSKHQETDGKTVAGYCVQHLADTMNGYIMIDVVGNGASPYDYLVNEYPFIRTIGLNAGEKSVEGDEVTPRTDRTGLFTFFDRRSEWWWRFRELLDPVHGMKVELPDDRELLKELRTPRFGIIPIKIPNSSIKGMIRIESKDEIKKRLKRSTDRADAVVMAFAEIPEDTSDWIRKMGGVR